MNVRFRYLLTGSVLLGLVACSSDAGVGVSRALEVEAFMNKGNGKLHRPDPTAAVDMQVAICEFTVTYTWSNLQGGSNTAVISLYEQIGTSYLQVVETEIPRQGGNGSVTHIFSLTQGLAAERPVHARAYLNDKDGQELYGSRNSSTSVQSTCD